MTLENFLNENIQKNTKEGYNSALVKYMDFHGKSVNELIVEALTEQIMAIPLCERKVTKRLILFKRFLINSDVSISTARTYFSKVKAFYRFNNIEIPKIPNIERTLGDDGKRSPTIIHIKKAFDDSSLEMRAVILFMLSSGTTTSQTVSLTVGDFIRASEDYHDGGSVSDVLKQLKSHYNVVPTFHLRNDNVGNYYTFCSGEAARYIVDYLYCRNNLKCSDKLFDMSSSNLILKFREINDSNSWGYIDHYRFFTPYSLRKFHAENLGLSKIYINMLQGRLTSHRNVKFRDLKELYIAKMHNVELFTSSKLKNQEFSIIINLFF